LGGDKEKSCDNGRGKGGRAAILADNLISPVLILVPRHWKDGFQRSVIPRSQGENWRKSLDQNPPPLKRREKEICRRRLEYKKKLGSGDGIVSWSNRQSVPN